MSFFKYNKKQVYYTEEGTGKPLLLLHGNTASSKMFDQIAQEYARYFKVVLIDFLGHGKSDRLDRFPADLWFEEAAQVIELIKLKDYRDIHILGCSGGAIVAINVALEFPEIVNKVVADSFEGTRSLKEFADSLAEKRMESMADRESRMFYQYMHGADWKQVVDNDTRAITRHNETIGSFFHRPLSSVKADVLLTGSKTDECFAVLGEGYLEKTYSDIITGIGHGEVVLYEEGCHPAMFSNAEKFITDSLGFLLR